MNTRESLAEYAHEAWSGWMKYLFSKCTEEVRFEKGIHFTTGNLVIPKWAVERWKRQSSTPYKDLPKAEQDSDLEESDKLLAIFVKETNE